MDNVKAPPAERCYHCGAPLRRHDGHLRYWSELRPGPSGWPISVRVCMDCRYRWQQGEEDVPHGR